MPTQLESFVHGYFQQVGLLKPPVRRSQRALSNREERQKIASSVIWSLNNKITKANFFKPFEEAGVSKTVMQRLLNDAMEAIYESHPVMGDGLVISHQIMQGKDATYRRDYRGVKRHVPTSNPVWQSLRKRLMDMTPSQIGNHPEKALLGWSKAALRKAFSAAVNLKSCPLQVNDFVDGRWKIFGFQPEAGTVTTCAATGCFFDEIDDLDHIDTSAMHMPKLYYTAILHEVLFNDGKLIKALKSNPNTSAHGTKWLATPKPAPRSSSKRRGSSRKTR